MTKTTYDVLIAEDYEQGGEKRSKFHNVGTAWSLDNKDGLSVELHPGLAVSGRLLVLPRRAREETGGQA